MSDKTRLTKKQNETLKGLLTTKSKTFITRDTGQGA